MARETPLFFLQKKRQPPLLAMEVTPKSAAREPSDGYAPASSLGDSFFQRWTDDGKTRGVPALFEPSFRLPGYSVCKKLWRTLHE